MKRKVLGKGIDAIIANKPTAPEADKGFMEIEIDEIYANPRMIGGFIWILFVAFLAYGYFLPGILM